MDLAKRAALLNRIGSVNTLRSDLPLVTLEEFFDGNDDGGSVWCNIVPTPGPDRVRAVLQGIRDRDEVADVRMMVTQYDGGDTWPFSDTIYFVARASEQDVFDWLGEHFRPDEIWSGEGFGRGEALVVPEGFNVIGAWWD